MNKTTRGMSKPKTLKQMGVGKGLTQKSWKSKGSKKKK